MKKLLSFMVLFFTLSASAMAAVGRSETSFAESQITINPVEQGSPYADIPHNEYCRWEDGKGYQCFPPAPKSGCGIDQTCLPSGCGMFQTCKD